MAAGGCAEAPAGVEAGTEAEVEAARSARASVRGSARRTGSDRLGADGLASSAGGRLLGDRSVAKASESRRLARLVGGLGSGMCGGDGLA